MTDLEISKIIEQGEANAIPDSRINTSEIPAETDFSGYYFGNKKYFEVTPKKTPVSIRMNTIVYDHLKSLGSGWQTKLNDFLMTAVAQGKI